VARAPFWFRIGERLPRVSREPAAARAARLLTFHLIAITWVFFRARSLGDAWLILTRRSLNLVRDPVLASRISVHAEHYWAFALIAFLMGVDDRRTSAGSIFQRLGCRAVAFGWAVYSCDLRPAAARRWQARESSTCSSDA